MIGREKKIIRIRRADKTIEEIPVVLTIRVDPDGAIFQNYDPPITIYSGDEIIDGFSVTVTLRDNRERIDNV